MTFLNFTKTIMLLTLLLTSTFLLSQETYTIKGTVKSETGKPIKDARVNFTLSAGTYVRTDSDGKFEINFVYTSPTELLISHVGYEQKKVLINKPLLRTSLNGIITLKVTLTYNTLDEVIVRGTRKPDTVFGSKITSVADYEFVGDKMVLLSYSKSLKKKAYLQLTSKRNTLITTYKTPKNPKRLFKDFEDRLYLITESQIFLISIVKNEFRLRPVDKTLFYNFTSRIIDTCNTHFLYSDFSENYPAFNYYSQYIYDSISKPIHHVENQFMMELYRAEYKYAPQKQKLWAFRQELVTGIDKEIWIGSSNFTQSIYYEPLYAPLFVNNDTVLIFDHYSDYLIKINFNFNKLDSVPIVYHKKKDKKNWEQPLLKDKDEHKVYGLFLRNGYYYLKPINLVNGSTLISFKLNYRYVENVKVENGYVYYIYRPYESSQKKFLYREVIDTSIKN